MSLSAPTPPLLLTKRLTSFLRSNLNPQIHTALLTTLSGKLLSHASPHPVSGLRTQCTVAASIWAIYTAPMATESITDALSSASSSAQPPAPTGVTVQLSGGVLVVRKLRCGLLFVCIGPAPDGTGMEQQQHGATTHQQSDPVLAPQQSASSASDAHHSSPLLGSPSEVESVVSTGGQTTASIMTTASVGATGVVLMRRQAEELARWLDDKLGSLGIPEEGWS